MKTLELEETAVASFAASGGYAAPRTEIKCRGCGCFSSAQYCWHCSTQPERIFLLMRVVDYARLHIETAPLPPEHPLSIAVRDYYALGAA